MLELTSKDRKQVVGRPGFQSAWNAPIARKVSASVQVDGLSIEGALESAGASDDDESLRAAMGLGQALYDAWTRL